ncbi:hypothetical protein RIF29_18704 [Crotalaria pallida]|uniref:Uncharacterized protein n=1 Tax=Crotalaria pallida TaxID=3830 RepID=A0AAN9I5S6_CROPI
MTICPLISNSRSLHREWVGRKNPRSHPNSILLCFSLAFTTVGFTSRSSPSHPIDLHHHRLQQLQWQKRQGPCLKPQRVVEKFGALGIGRREGAYGVSFGLFFYVISSRILARE